MDFESWLQHMELEMDDLTPTQETALRAKFDREQNIPMAKPYEGAGSNVARIAASVKAKHRTNTAKLQELEALHTQAIAEQWSDQQAELAFLRADTWSGPLVYERGSSGAPQLTDVLAGAMAVSYGESESTVGKWFADPRAADAAFSKRFRGISLQGVMRAAMEANGQDAPRGKFSDADIRRAFSSGASAMAGPSTISVTGILSNLANKSLLAEYGAMPMTWQKWCAIRSVNDFKAATQYRATMLGSLGKIPAGGEIPHVSLEEADATAQADSYGGLLAISRKDIINDDLGVFVAAPKSLARLAAIGLEKAVYTVLMGSIGNGTSFIFDTAGSKLNYDAGAVDSVLSLAGLDNGYAMFAAQVDANGDPLFITPKILLVPPTLAATARTLTAATETVGGSTNVANGNPWAGMFEVVESPYVNSSAITGYTSTGWFLLAPPSDFSVLQVAFLQGQQQPTIEAGEFDFDKLGMAWRAVFDWGVSELDYRGGVHLKGAA